LVSSVDNQQEPPPYYAPPKYMRQNPEDDTYGIGDFGARPCPHIYIRPACCTASLTHHRTRCSSPTDPFPNCITSWRKGNAWTPTAPCSSRSQISNNTFKSATPPHHITKLPAHPYHHHKLSQNSQYTEMAYSETNVYVVALSHKEMTIRDITSMSYIHFGLNAYATGQVAEKIVSIC
jgi:hypothetical protein